MYDLIVLGGGPAGYLAGERAAAEGMKVLLLEAGRLGGVCLNEGCIPTKTLLYSAKLKDGAAFGSKYGIKCGDISIDHDALVRRKDKVVNMLVGGVTATLKACGVEVVNARGRIAGRTGNGYAVSADGKSYEGRRLLIATGSQAAIPPIDGLKEQLDAGFVMTSREMLSCAQVPKSLVVIGGGVIGLELASYFHSAGSSVTVIEMLERIGGPIDEEIANLLLRNLKKKGIAFRLGSSVKQIERDGVVFETEAGAQRLAAEKVLLCIGRVPNTSELGLENIDIAMDGRAIKTDEHMRTNQPNVYAAGDVNGRSMLAHTAYREAEAAINAMAGKRDRMTYNAIPGVIYTSPEVACVGETEQSAKAKGMDVTVKKISMMYSGRYAAENEGGDGICKIVVDNTWDKLVGVHLIGGCASEIIWGADALIGKEMTLDEIKTTVFPHPTVSEIIREAVFAL